ncbi:hypothetical protein [Budvicia aquatica]|uniref:Uncharacterized protein n=1 Tax=Budvicia aquatica TaxID=82979 RepID=A0A484ZHU4_9GAMM|nr:hypothetical protein [Budvicia aquatica]VFS47241.1 Uncharacterised protein [Budvicia aquatica]
MLTYRRLFLPIGIIATLSISYSANAVPPYYNDSGVVSSGLWDWQNKGNVIGGGDGNSGELILQGSASYNNSFSVGYNGASGSLTIKDNAANVNGTTGFKVGTTYYNQALGHETSGTFKSDRPRYRYYKF